MNKRVIVHLEILATENLEKSKSNKKWALHYAQKNDHDRAKKLRSKAAIYQARYEAYHGCIVMLKGVE